MMAVWLRLIGWALLFNFVAEFLLRIMGDTTHADARMTGLGIFLGYKGIAGISIIALLVYMTISVVRRLHDLNRSGWWIVAPIVLSIIVGLIIYASISSVRMVFGGIFIINLCWFFYLTLAPGSKSANRFGPARYTSSTEKSLGWISMVLFLLIAVFVGTMILILGQVRKTSMATSAMSTASGPVAGSIHHAFSFLPQIVNYRDTCRSPHARR